MLRFARGDTLERTPTELNSVVQIACDSVADYLQSRRCLLDVSLASDLPTVAVNSGGIEQVLQNLLRNAADASEAGDKIGVLTAIAGNHVHIRVRDHGIGISPDVLPRICDPFYTTRRDRGGTGLGLSIAPRHRGRPRWNHALRKQARPRHDRDRGTANGLLSGRAPPIRGAINSRPPADRSKR